MSKFIVVIRIRGQIGIRGDVKETLNRLRIRKKYSCVVFENPNEVIMGMINKVRDFVAFGEIKKEDYEELKKVRGKKDKTFFRLHPPRKGIEAKKHFGVGKGVLGNNGDKINELLRRML